MIAHRLPDGRAKRDGLYASLSDTQRQGADTLFRQQATAAAQPRTRR